MDTSSVAITVMLCVLVWREVEHRRKEAESKQEFENKLMEKWKTAESDRAVAVATLVANLSRLTDKVYELGVRVCLLERETSILDATVPRLQDDVHEVKAALSQLVHQVRDRANDSGYREETDHNGKEPKRRGWRWRFVELRPEIHLGALGSLFKTWVN